MAFITAIMPDAMPEHIPLYDPEQPQPRRPLSTSRVERYRVMPWPDGTRVTVEMNMTPATDFPSIEVSIVNTLGEVVRSVTMVSAAERQPSPTMWLPRVERGTPMMALIEILADPGDPPLQTIEVPFEVAGPIIKQLIDVA
jgi:hypothetical protein